MTQSRDQISQALDTRPPDLRDTQRRTACPAHLTLDTTYYSYA